MSRLKVLSISALAIISASLLASCSASATCELGTSTAVGDTVSICALVEGKNKNLTEGSDYKNLVLLSKLVAFNVEVYPQYVFEETPQKNNDLLNTLSENRRNLKVEDFTYYVAGDARWDPLIQSFSALKTAELNFTLAPDVETRRMYLDKREQAYSELRPKLEVLISDLMGRYEIFDRVQIRNFAVLLYKSQEF